MRRREVLAASAALAACSKAPESQTRSTPTSPRKRRWKMVTTWPTNFPGLGTGAARLAQTITVASAGRIEVDVYGAGELVPAFEVFDAVSRGTAQIGHGAAYYWKGKHPGSQFFGSVPFGFNAQEMHGWLFFGGGLELWQRLYQSFGLRPFPAGNTGVQMAGWFRRPIETIDDLQGLKMRIPGLGGEILRRAGGVPVSLPGGEIFTALQSGANDATEWVGPYNDLAFGLHQAAKVCHYPGWHEPGTTLEAIINLDEWNDLGPDLQTIVREAATAENTRMLAEFTARNFAALQSLQREHEVQFLPLPDAVLGRLRDIANEVLAEEAQKNALAGEIFASFQDFAEGVFAWHRISEQSYYAARQ